MILQLNVRNRDMACWKNTLEVEEQIDRTDPIIQHQRTPIERVLNDVELLIAMVVPVADIPGASGYLKSDRRSTPTEHKAE